MRPSRLRRTLQVGAFARKEVVDVVRQPRLLVSLVLAPFVTLAAFGLGYRDETRAYRAWLVAPAGSELLPPVREGAAGVSEFLTVVGEGPDEAAAMRLLADDQIDIVVVLPGNPADEVVAGRRALITIVHDRIDPIERTAIDFASRIAVDEVNAQVLGAIVESGQQLLASLTDGSTLTEQVASADAGDDRAVTDERLDVLESALRRAQATLEARTAFTDPMRTPTETDRNAAAVRALEEATTSLVRARAAVATGDAAAARTELGTVATSLDTIDRELAAVRAIPADVLVRPFEGAVRSAIGGRRSLSDFYAPAAVMLLVQQFGIAFGSLSFVRERELGLLELFRAAPLGAAETVIGKYLGYAAIGGVVSAGLVSMVVFGLDVPMVGAWGDVAVVVGATLVASIGLGLAISLASSSDAQAVQYTMITLLASLFFSGFFLAVERLAYPARAISWLLPATLGSRLLRDVMLRGLEPDRSLVVAMWTYAAAAFVVTLAGTHRRLAGRT